MQLLGSAGSACVLSGRNRWVASIPAPYAARPQLALNAATPALADAACQSDVILECTKLLADGRGLCRRDDGLIVLVDGALPGEKLRASITEVKAGHAEASKTAVLKAPTGAVPAPCSFFGACGGCQLQSINYEEQLKHKRQLVVDALSRIGKLPGAESLVYQVLGCASTPAASADEPATPASAAHPATSFAYRNNMQFAAAEQVSNSATGQLPGVPSLPVQLGLKAARSHNVVVVDQCLLQNSTANAILQFCSAALPYYLNSTSTVDSKQAFGTRISAQVQQVIIRSGHGPQRQNKGSQPASSSERLRPPQQLQQLKQQKQEQEADLQDLKYAHKDVTMDGSTASVNGANIGACYSKSQERHTTPLSCGSNHTCREYMVNVVTSTEAHLQPFAAALASQFPSVVSVVNTVSQKDSKIDSRRGRARRGAPRVASPGVRSQEDVGETVNGRSLPVWGAEHITEQLLGLQLRISAQSFFQVNTAQAEVLYRTAANMAGLRPTDVLLDLFCGTGSIGLSMAHSVSHVIGVDINSSAIQDAQYNADLNGIRNAAFHIASLHTAEKLLDGFGKIDVVVVDPARAGLPKTVVQYLQACSARTVVYISCNPATQARDLALLLQAGTHAGDTCSIAVQQNVELLIANALLKQHRSHE